MRDKVTPEQAEKAANMVGLNLDAYGLDNWLYALNVEMEHKNITQGNIKTTAQIAKAHISEIPDYYKRLKRMEATAQKFWDNKEHPVYFS